MSISHLMAAEDCGDEYYIDEALPNGSRWDMCWEHRHREGIVFHHIYYTPKDGQRRMVLREAAIAQIHVPYDDNGSRFHDVSDYGIGDASMLDLTSSDCLGGERLTFGDKHVLCKQIETQEVGFKKGKNAIKSHTLSLYSVSPVAAYYYVPVWRFMDNGKIEPWMGATGALQRFGGFESRGWKLGDGRTGISHLHNFFWKLDFDLNGTANNDLVEEINFPLKDGKRQREVTVFGREASRKVDPNNMRMWRIVDKDAKNSNSHAISYDIILGETGHQDIGPASEPFTHNDFYVSKQKDSERFASHNPGQTRNLAEYTNNEIIAGEDIVIWTGVTFYHMPRSEDAPHMDAHWSHLEIIPRDWHASNPLGQKTTYNASPEVEPIDDKKSLIGENVHLTIKATDNEILTYSSEQLPEGLSIDTKTGIISGILTKVGDYNVAINVNDTETTTTVHFNWQVKEPKVNHLPVLTSIGAQTLLVGDSIRLSIKATDEDGDILSYSATSLPIGLTIDSKTGVISGQLTSAGQFSSKISVKDAVATDTMNLEWTVIAPVSNKVADVTLTLDGQLTDWKGEKFFAKDADDISGKNNQINWLMSALAHDSHFVYMAYQNNNNVDSSLKQGHYLPAGWKVYLDTDNNAETGYIVGDMGADYLIEGTHILRYLGTGSSWAWESKGFVKSVYQGKTAEIKFNRALIGNPEKIRVVFVGDNKIFGGGKTDRYPDSGFFNYAFTGVSTENTPPVSNNQTISVGSGASISVILTATDVDLDTLIYNVITQPEHGSLSGSAPNMIFTADNNFIGKDSFTFRVNDGKADSAVATVSININPQATGLSVSNYIKQEISIDGEFTDWDNLTAFPADDDRADTKGVIDWEDITLAHSRKTLYLRYKNRRPIDPLHQQGDYLGWGWRTYIDADKNAVTGFNIGGMGADYILEGNKLLSYTGRGNNLSWKAETSIQSRFNGNSAELALPRQLIGNPVSVRVLFVGDNQAYQIGEKDLYPDEQNDFAASTRFYIYDFLGDTISDDRPVGFSQMVTAYSGTQSIISLVAIDPNNDHLTFHVVDQPKHGKLTGDAPELVYEPAKDYIGSDGFTFNVNDGQLTSATVAVLINVTGLQGGVYSNLVNSISIDGNIEEWGGLAAFGDDADDVTIKDSTKRIDWKRAAVAHNGETLYFFYQNQTIINPDNNSGSYLDRGWQTYMDTDGKISTGYKVGNMGADYLLEGSQLLEYTGSGDNWSWRARVMADLKYNANAVEISFPRHAIGNPDRLNILFAGDNSDYGGSVDYYPDNKSAIVYQLKGDEDLLIDNRPVAKPLAFDVSKDSIRFDLVADDKDNDKLTYHIVTLPLHGKIENFETTSKTIQYIPDTSYTGKDSFSYIANDGTYDSSIATISLTIKPAKTSGSDDSGSESGSGGSGESGDNNSGGSGLILPDIMLLLFGLFLFQTRKSVC